VTRNLIIRVISVILTTLIVAVAPALVNPSLQPGDVAARHVLVAAGTVAVIDEAQRLVTIDLSAVLQGKSTLKRLVLAVPMAATAVGQVGGGGGGGRNLFDAVHEGDHVVLFLGKSGAHGNPLAGLIYHDEWFHEIVGDAQDPARWTWQNNTGDKMWGCFNGASERLAEMVADDKAGRFFFPALPFNRFKPEQVLGAWDGSLRGVAAADLDGDGRLDAVTVSESGCHVLLQTKPEVFTDRTMALGLASAKSWSVSAADADDDGRIDLLLDGCLFRNRADGTFVADDRLPAAAAKDVKVAAFIELDGDGFPDVLVSRIGGGLTAWLNPGAKGGPFIDVTSKLALDRPECGAGLTGFVACGDWNGDGRTDLFYSAGKGLLLVQDASGVFQPQPSGSNLSFKLSDGSERDGLTGGASFAGLWNPGSTDIVVPGDLGLSLIANVGGKGEDRAGAGNESHLTRTSQLAVLAEDLNCDGNIDLYTLTRQVNSHNSFHSNRGYGSYMMDDLYEQDAAFPGTSYTTGQWGAVAADFDGDGAPDLLLAGVDGKLRLHRNDVLNHRTADETAKRQDQILASTSMLAVDIVGTRAVVGAKLTVRYADGRVAGWRRLGDQVLTGCGPAHQARFAVREPGMMNLEVRWSDGRTQQQAVMLEPGKVTKVALAGR